MIVPMKKAAIITQKKDTQNTINSLRKLGVLHIEHQKPPKGGDVSRILEDINLLNNCLEAISQIQVTEACKKEHWQEIVFDWKLKAKHIIDVKKRIEQLEDYSRQMSQKINEWQPWGDFDINLVYELSRKNIFVKLYQIPEKELKNFPSNICLKEISRVGGLIYLVAISRQTIETQFKEVALPKLPLGQMQRRIEEDSKVIQSLKKELHQDVCFKEEFLKIKNTLTHELNFYEALSGAGEFSKLSYVVGYIPFDSQNNLIEEAKNNQWGIMISDPSETDEVPTLVRNPKWVSIISPLFKVIEVVPGYKELDISLVFLIFFSIFFGIIIGDAGYGVVYALLAFLIQKKRGFKQNEKPTFFLFYILTSCAIIWGLLTGTIFGQGWLPKSIKPIIPALNEVKVFQSFCFFLGALHLSLAHSWRVILKIPSLTALVDLGWICVLWTVFFLARALILGYNYPVFANWLVGIGILLVVLFTNPQKNILKAVGSGLGNVALSLMNNFTDVVSYVRLFAVSSAGVAVADTFNNMALGLGAKNIVTIILSALILLCGHALNLVLGPISILVHGVRLNVLEFCSHVDIKWIGFRYKPLE